MLDRKTIRAARESREMTQLEVAIAAGVSINSIRLWETGGVRPNSENERKLREALSLEMEDTDATGEPYKHTKAAI
jgi:transcriptional regulator with XRE-family HTH domain